MSRILEALGHRAVSLGVFHHSRHMVGGVAQSAERDGNGGAGADTLLLLDGLAVEIDGYRTGIGNLHSDVAVKSALRGEVPHRSLGSGGCAVHLLLTEKIERGYLGAVGEALDEFGRGHCGVK